MAETAEASSPLETALANFTPEQGVSANNPEKIWSEFEAESRARANERLLQLQANDVAWHVRSRPRFGWVIVGILIGQNVMVFGLVWVALGLGALNSLQVVFSVLLSATLAETYFTLNIVIKWLFEDINYKLY